MVPPSGVDLTPRRDSVLFMVEQEIVVWVSNHPGRVGKVGSLLEIGRFGCEI